MIYLRLEDRKKHHGSSQRILRLDQKFPRPSFVYVKFVTTNDVEGSQIKVAKLPSKKVLTSNFGYQGRVVQSTIKLIQD